MFVIVRVLLTNTFERIRADFMTAAAPLQPKMDRFADVYISYYFRISSINL